MENHLITRLLGEQPVSVNLLQTAVAMLLAGLLGQMLARFYNRYGGALSNRDLFARNFTPLAMTTALIISVVKSSLALSLGLVGALSIVRFRSAIKEPEELIFLFLAIAVGLGMGAGQATLTVIAFTMILVAILLIRPRQGSGAPNFHLVIGGGRKKIPVESVLTLVERHASRAALRRLDDSPAGQEISLQADFADSSALARCKEALQREFPGTSLSFLETRNLP